MGATETLARYASAVKLEDFPAEPVLQAKHFIQNEIGCALGGAQTELGKRTIAVAHEIGVGGKGEATLIGDGARMSCVLAAHANTELAETLDFDDEHKFTLTHPSCSIVSTALAVGEMTGASGKDASISSLRRLRIACSYDPDGIALGASIACSGVCLTVVAVAGLAEGSRSHCSPTPRGGSVPWPYQS